MMASAKGTCRSVNASTILCASAAFGARGFSHRHGLAASAQAMLHSACRLTGSGL